MLWNVSARIAFMMFTFALIAGFIILVALRTKIKDQLSKEQTGSGTGRAHEPLVGKYVNDYYCWICDKEFDLNDDYIEIIVRFHKNSDNEWVETWTHRDCAAHVANLLGSS